MDEKIGSDYFVQPGQDVPELYPLPRRSFSKDWSLEDPRNSALEVLEQRNYLRRDGEGRIICNLDTIKNLDYKNIHDLSGMARVTLPNGRHTKPLYKSEALAELFKDISVYSEEDYARVLQGDEVSEKPLFYIPNSLEEAFSIPAIRQADFYMPLWEVSSYIRDYPTRTPHEGLLSKQEVATSCVIYNQKYGNGMRDNDGRLIVSYPDGQRGPITSRFFREWGYGGNTKGTTNPVGNHPSKFFIEECPEMVKRGLILPDVDFRIQQGSSSKEVLGGNLRRVGENGMIMFEGIQYVLGRDLKGLPIQQVSQNEAIIYRKDENGKLLPWKKIHLHTLLPDQRSRMLEGRSNTNSIPYPIVRQEQVVITDIENQEEENPLVSHEQLSEFMRLAAIEGISLDKFDRYEEKALATAVYLHYKDNPALWSYLQQHKLDGLKSLMILEGDGRDIAVLLELSKHVNMTRMFKNISSIYTKLIEPSTSNSEDSVIAKTYLQLSARLLSASPAVSDPNFPHAAEFDFSSVANAIESLRNRVDQIYSGRNTHQDATYERMLAIAKETPTSSEIYALAESSLQEQWRKQSLGDEAELEKILAASDAFYERNTLLFETVNNTTGDTTEQLRQLSEYFKQRSEEGKDTKVILDIGCGEGERITKPMVDMVGNQVKVIGMDRLPPDMTDKPENLTFIQGDFTDTRLPDNSVSVVTANWSVLNDLVLRSQQDDAFAELARILPIDGEFYGDVPYIEGEGGWGKAVDEYHDAHQDQPKGLAVCSFPGGKQKIFYLYPADELDARFRAAGFDIVKSHIWYTASGMPRRTISAKLMKKDTPFLMEHRLKKAAA